MATIAHAILGMALARRYCRPLPPLRTLAGAMVFFAALALLPDLDLIGTRMGIPQGDPLGHRGAFHSLAAALLFALIGAVIARLAGLEFKRTFRFCLLATLSHGLIDAMTKDGVGVAFFWPFSEARYFLPWRPFPIAPIGLGLFTPLRAEYLAFELLWFSPLLLYALWPRNGVKNPGS